MPCKRASARSPRPACIRASSSAPDQLPALRQLLQTTVQGSFVLSRIEQNNANLRKPGQEVATVYDHLVQGDLDAMKYASTDWLKNR